MKKTSSNGSFKYKPRSAEDLQKRMTIGGNREGFTVEGVKIFAPKAGTHTVRIMPPTWKEPEHYGFDVYGHYNIGPDGSSYLCLKRMKDKPCPICDERTRATREGDEDLAEALKWRRRVACYVIDRDNEREGPSLWFMPQSLDLDIVKISKDRKTGEVYNLDDPEDGYDLSFEREGQGLNTKYVGVVIERRTSPLSDEEDVAQRWLKFIEESPVPDLLIYRSTEELEEVVGDGLTAPKDARNKKKKDEDEERPRGRARLRSADDEDEKPKRRTRDEDEDDEKPKRKARDEDEDEDEKPERKGRDDEDEDEDEKPKRRTARDDDEEEEKPKRRSTRDDDEDEKPSTRSRLDKLRKNARDD